MTFKQEYKNECFRILQHSTNIELIMKTLEENNSLVFRMYLEEYIDELQKNLTPRILTDWGDALIYNSIVNQYYEVNKLYSTFMIEYLQEVDLKIPNKYLI